MGPHLLVVKSAETFNFSTVVINEDLYDWLILIIAVIIK